MAREVKVCFPVEVNVMIPDGYELDDQELAEVAWETVELQHRSCIHEVKGEPVEWANCWAEVLTDETEIDGKKITAGLPVQQP